MAFPLKYPWSQTNCKLESLESYESSFDNLHISQERHINKAGNVEENRNGINPGCESEKHFFHKCHCHFPVFISHLKILVLCGLSTPYRLTKEQCWTFPPCLYPHGKPAQNLFLLCRLENIEFFRNQIWNENWRAWLCWTQRLVIIGQFLLEQAL